MSLCRVFLVLRGVSMCLQLMFMGIHKHVYVQQSSARTQGLKTGLYLIMLFT